MNRWKSAVLTAVLSVLLGLSMGLVSFAEAHSWKTETDNQIMTGNVSIRIQEQQRDKGGTEIPDQNDCLVLPGQRTDHVVSVLNEGNSAWIRAKADFWSEGSLKGLDYDLLGGMDPSWVKCGDYYYFTEPVPTEGAAVFFRSITIPRDWGQEVTGKRFGISITAQAIQSAGFHPDFEQEFPWFGVPIEDAVQSGYGPDSSVDQSVFQLIFENGSEGFVRTTDDFFEHFGSIQPGETRTGTLQIGSHYGRAIDLWFRTEILEDQSEEAKLLMENLTLTIQKENEILYQGSLGSDKLQSGLILCKGLRSGQTHDFTYSVFMPETLGNESGMLTSRVRWIFSADCHTSTRGGGNGSGDFVTKTNDSSEVPAEIKSPLPEISLPSEWMNKVLETLPFTGDRKKTDFLFLVLVASSLAFASLHCREIRKYLLISVLLAACVLGRTLAYYTDFEQLGRTFSVGTNTIVIPEENVDWESMTAGVNVYSREVFAENTGTIPCYVRIFADFADSAAKEKSELSADGSIYYAASEYANHLPDGWSFVDPEEHDSLGGFYYYQYALEPGEKTPPLFAWVCCTLEDTEEASDYEVLVFGESVQTRDCTGAVFSGTSGWRQAWQEFLERR